FTWPGNVRQLENICRWLTVMAPGQDVHLQDLPPEMQAAESAQPPRAAAPAAATATTAAPAPVTAAVANSVPQPDGAEGLAWNELLREWASRELKAGHSDLLGTAVPLFERTM